MIEYLHIIAQHGAHNVLRPRPPKPPLSVFPQHRPMPGVQPFYVSPHYARKPLKRK